MYLKRWSLLIWGVGGLALVLGLLSPRIFEAELFSSIVKSSGGWSLGGFIPTGVYPTTNPGSLPAGVETFGSWNDGDAWQGRAETIWLPVSAETVRVWVAGYPQHRGCLLRVEFRRRDGSVVQVMCPTADPGETWSPWDVRRPVDARVMRIVAEDNASDSRGWLAFSEPMAVRTETATIYMALQVFATFALTLTLVWGPGLLWGPRSASATSRVIWVLGAGPLTLAALGALIWLLGGFVTPKVLGFALIGAVWIALGVSLARKNFASGASYAHVQALAVSALCALAAVARAANSDGPEGELYGGLISRSLAVGDRSDSRISYYIPQIIQRHLSPASAEAERYFTPWTFFSRGPLAGLAATPILFATGGIPAGPGQQPAEATAFHRWQRFDQTGFAAYRIVLITLASTVIFALFSVLVPFVGERWALIGCGLLALSPFGVHEVMFTWPKFEATAWVLASFLLCHQRRSLGAGLALAVGFLFHPMAALWAPWLVLWTGGRAAPRAVRPFFAASLRFAAGFCVLALPWMALGQMPPQLEESVNAGQGGFVEYFRLAGYAPATWETWWNSRAIIFANTFLPFWLHVYHEHNSAIGSVYGPVGPVVKFAFGWWNTLPLGLGLGLWAICLFALCRAARRFAAAIGMLIVGPALLLTAYWGAYVTGLMRECGHPLHAAIIGVACLALASFPGRIASLVAHPIFPWLQLPETFLMLWLTTYLNPHQPAVDGSSLNPLFFAINVLALGTAAWVLGQARRNVEPHPTPSEEGQ